MKIAIVYDRLLRPDTTGTHVEEALRELGHQVAYFAPLASVSGGKIVTNDMAALGSGFDLYLQVDDDIGYPGPVQYHPSAYWCVDTHRMNQMAGGWSRLRKAEGFDYVFTAQRDGVDIFRNAGYGGATWLPLACNPKIHRRIAGLPTLYKWCFVGSMTPQRRALTDALRARWLNCFVGTLFGEAMTRMYTQSRIILNRSVGNDINMRVFEAMACGGLLITNRVGNGEELLFDDSLLAYGSVDELTALFEHYLRDDAARESVAARQHALVHERHSYRRRMEEMLGHIFAGKAHEGAVVPERLHASHDGASPSPS
ncbi:MAG: glycosyltransferase [Chlamydiota bacterium]